MDKVLYGKRNEPAVGLRPARRQRTRLSSVTTAVRLLKLFSVQDHELGISEITVKAHRGKVMRKMKADSLAELVNMAGRLHLAPMPPRNQTAVRSPASESPADPW